MRRAKRGCARPVQLARASPGSRLRSSVPTRDPIRTPTSPARTELFRRPLGRSLFVSGGLWDTASCDQEHRERADVCLLHASVRPHELRFGLGDVLA